MWRGGGGRLKLAAQLSGSGLHCVKPNFTLQPVTFPSQFLIIFTASTQLCGYIFKKNCIADVLRSLVTEKVDTFYYTRTIRKLVRKREKSKKYCILQTITRITIY